MRRLFLLLATLSMALMPALAFADGGSDSDFIPAPIMQSDSVDFTISGFQGNLVSGEVIDVAVQFDATTPVAGVQVFLNVDPTVMSVDSITIGSVFEEHNWRVLLNSFDNATGTIDFAGGRDPTVESTDAVGPTDLVMIRFQVLEDAAASSVRFNTELPRVTKAAATDPVREVTGALPTTWLGMGVCGDLTGDGVLNNIDAVYGLQIIANPSLAPASLPLGDLVRDQEFNVLDVQGMLDAITGSWQPLSCGPL